jgi:hypothetical protein
MTAKVNIALIAASSAKAKAPRGIAPPMISQTARSKLKSKSVNAVPVVATEMFKLTSNRSLGMLIDRVEIGREGKRAVSCKGEGLT